MKNCLYVYFLDVTSFTTKEEKKTITCIPDYFFEKGKRQRKHLLLLLLKPVI